MPNGNGLHGSTTSSQSAMIVKQPGNLNMYYIFTTDGVAGAYGFCYSTVDMNLQGGLGDVVVKNSSSSHLPAKTLLPPYMRTALTSG
jgi:hypothetical protein